MAHGFRNGTLVRFRGRFQSAVLTIAIRLSDRTRWLRPREVNIDDRKVLVDLLADDLHGFGLSLFRDFRPYLLRREEHGSRGKAGISASIIRSGDGDGMSKQQQSILPLSTSTLGIASIARAADLPADRGRARISRRKFHRAEVRRGLWLSE
jgi:hypothetical protein